MVAVPESVPSILTPNIVLFVYWPGAARYSLTLASIAPSANAVTERHESVIIIAIKIDIVFLSIV